MRLNPDGSRGKSRHIDRPVRNLKAIQRSIARGLLMGWEAPSGMYGAVPGRSALHNAARHVDSPVVVALDVSNCFPSITDRQVFEAFRDTVGCSDEIASLLTRLTTVGHHLPQGAPSSSYLANMVLLPAYIELEPIVAKMGVVMTFFVDDVTLSGARAREAIDVVERSIRRLGLSLNRDKIQIMPAGSRQRATGLVVNRKLTVGRDRMKGFREELMAWRRHGAPANAKARVQGRIQWVAAVSPRQATKLRDLAEVVLAGARIQAARPRYEIEVCTCRLGKGMGASSKQVGLCEA